MPRVRPIAAALLVASVAQAQQPELHADISAVEPARGATGVARDTRVTVKLRKAIDPELIEAGYASIHVMSLDPAAKSIEGAVAYDAGERALVFTPDEPFPAESTHIVTVKVSDVLKDISISQQWRFQTGSALGPGPERIRELLAQLRDRAARERAAAEIEKAGAAAIEALRKAIEAEKDEAQKARLQALLDIVGWPEGGPVHDGVRLTLKLDKRRVVTGGTLAASVRVEAEAGRELALETENPPVEGASELERVVRLVVIDTAGRHRAIGAFQNLDRGPDRIALKLAPGEAVARIAIRPGISLRKGGRSEDLTPGEYRVYAVLGDPRAAWSGVRPAPLRSNEIVLRISVID
jgi:hypothetical protein